LENKRMIIQLRPPLIPSACALVLLMSCVVFGQGSFDQQSLSVGPVRQSEKLNSVQLRFVDGTSIRVDEAWESEQGVWYRQSGMSHLLARDRVRAIERNSNSDKQEGSSAKLGSVLTTGEASGSAVDQPVWIYLVGGARVEADSATESSDGVWYRRGSLTVFVDRSRVDHVERESSDAVAESDSHAKQERGWTTGNKQLDGLIRQNGMKYGVDPYLIFCVMEQESHFNSRALSPKGAKGLMQLMPGTAARFGVRRASDPAQNIAGGTRYLKQLIAQFDGRVDLVLASYNAGEGAVLKFGRKVPPYRETRDYVKKISYRYRRNKSTVFSKGELAAPNVRAGT
jgi:Zn-finger nucleic acid-binding protein